jgi:hypothetical protein
MLLREVAISLVSLSAPKTARRIVKDSTYKSMAFQYPGQVEVKDLRQFSVVAATSEHVVRVFIKRILSEVQGLAYVRISQVFVMAIKILRRPILCKIAKAVNQQKCLFPLFTTLWAIEGRGRKN